MILCHVHLPSHSATPPCRCLRKTCNSSNSSQFNLFGVCVLVYSSLDTTMAFCITFGTHGKSSWKDPRSRHQSGPCPWSCCGWRVSVLIQWIQLSVVILSILIPSPEFSSQLEGYEHVRAYCYNCKF